MKRDPTYGKNPWEALQRRQARLKPLPQSLGQIPATTAQMLCALPANWLHR